MGKLSSEELERYAGLGLDAIGAILGDLEAGALTAESAEEHILVAVARLVDMAVPTGPFDAIDDALIEDGIVEAYGLIKDLLHRDVDELRAAAERKLARVEEARAEGRNRIGLIRVDRVEEKARELLLRADMLEAREAGILPVVEEPE